MFLNFTFILFIYFKSFLFCGWKIWKAEQNSGVPPNPGGLTQVDPSVPADEDQVTEEFWAAAEPGRLGAAGPACQDQSHLKTQNLEDRTTAWPLTSDPTVSKASHQPAEGG